MDITICDLHHREMWDRAAALGLSRKRPLKLQLVGLETSSDCPICNGASFAFELGDGSDIATVKIISGNPQSAPANVA